MKQYQEQQDELNPGEVFGYTIDDMSIPKDPGNRHYNQMLAEVEAGEAEILPWVPPPPPPEVPVAFVGDVVASKKFVLIDENDNEVDVTAVLLALLP